MIVRFSAALWAIFLLTLNLPSTAADLEGLSPGTGPRHAIAMHGEPKYPQGFAAFPFIDPDAEQGGDLLLGLLGTFDSLNPYIVQGIAPKSAF